MIQSTQLEACEKLGGFLKSAGLSSSPDFDALLADYKASEQLMKAHEDRIASLTKDLRAAQSATYSPPVAHIPSTGKTVKFGGDPYPVMLDPDHEHFKFVPVDEYDKDFNSKAWRASLKVGASLHKAKCGDFLRDLVNGERTFLVGEPAVGKTSLVTQFAIATNWPLVRFQCKKETSVYDFIGHMSLNSKGETHWVNGALLFAMEVGAIFLMDEQDHLPAECSSFIHGLLESGADSIWIPMLGKRMKAKPGFRIVATGNTIGHGDASGRFVSANVQDAATLSRWSAVYPVERMTAKQESAVVNAKTGIGAELSDKLAKIGSDTNKEHKSKPYEFRSYVTLRDELSAARRYMLLPPELRTPTALGNALAFSCYAKADPTSVVAIADLASRVLGGLASSELPNEEDSE